MAKKKLAHEERAHSPLGASIAERWLNCSASVDHCEGLPSTSSPYATDGTEAHTVLEYAVRREFRLPPLPDISEIESHELFRKQQYAKDVVALLKSRFHVEPDELLVETKVDLSWIDPRMFGTLDIGIVKLFDRLTIIDYKFGTKRVRPAGNPQLIYYALGVAKQYHFDFADVELVVLQPRASGYPGESAFMTIPELKSWEMIFRNGAARTKDKRHRKFWPGEWCFFCPGKATCPAQKQAAEAEARAAFGDENEFEID